MDPRIREHAEIIANHSVDLEDGDNVVIDAHPVAEDLVVALHEVIGDRGANPITTSQRTGKRQQRAYLRASDDEFDTPEHELALVENTDVYIAIRATDNATQTSDVDPRPARPTSRPIARFSRSASRSAGVSRSSPRRRTPSSRR